MMTRFALVMPTLGREKEVREFINSLDNSNFDESIKVKLIIVNQNAGFDFTKEASNKADIININSDVKGLSVNRNVAIDYALDDGFDIVSFPDDDCTYYNDTIKVVKDYFDNHPDVDIVLGRIFDRKKRRNVIKNWPAIAKSVNKYNFYFLASSITIFCRGKVNLNFDENMGAGTKYGSCEDPDFLYNSLKMGYKVQYVPEIEVWHPEPNLNHVDLCKVKSYAKGFGFFISKNISLPTIALLIGCILKKIVQLIIDSRFGVSYTKSFFSGLFQGLFNR
ncbi:glycosyltransferase family 2 protein [Vibrio vulnificus]